MGDRHGEAIARDHLGDSLLASGDEAGANAAWEVSAAALTELGHPDADAVRSKLGSPRASH
jgi:predicted negative regulator of RcsB-dependent stress response